MFLRIISSSCIHQCPSRYIFVLHVTQNAAVKRLSINTMSSTRSSALFTAYRAIGFVCDGKQLDLQHLGREAFLTTSIGRAFQVYRVDHLSISLVSAQLRHTIRYALGRPRFWGKALLHPFQYFLPLTLCILSSFPFPCPLAAMSSRSGTSCLLQQKSVSQCSAAPGRFAPLRGQHRAPWMARNKAVSLA